MLNQEEVQELSKKLKFDNNGYNTLNNTNIINYLNQDLIKNSSLENGLMFSEEGLNLINTLKAFNYERIYHHEKIQKGDEYFKVVIHTIYDVIKSTYNNKIEKIAESKVAVMYPELIGEFTEWLANYCVQDNFINEPNSKLKNKKIFDINKKEDYYTAIVEYIAGMTDNKAIETYNKIISF